MAGNALAKLFSWADGVKRRTSNPLQTLMLGLTQASEDMTAAANDADVAYGRNGMKSVLLTPEERADAARRAAEFGANMGMGAMVAGRAKSSENSAMKKPTDYGIDHRPMQDAGGASRLHDLTTSYGEDVYGPNALQYFGSGDSREKSTLRMLQSLRGKPDAMVTIYRGVPDGTAGAINHGDWVTLDPKVARDYGGKVLKMQVPASHITAWPDSLLEYGYFPPSK